MPRRRYRSWNSYSQAAAMNQPAPEKTAKKIEQGARKADEEFPIEHDRLCTVCGAKLGRYNVTGQCMRHLPS